MGIEIRGGDKFEAKLKELKEKYPDVLDFALDDVAAAIHLDAADKYVPIDEGHLKNSINVKSEYLRKTVGTAMEYAAYIEFGEPPKTGPSSTTRPGPRPYLRPAFNNNKDRTAEFFVKNLP